MGTGSISNSSSNFTGVHNVSGPSATSETAATTGKHNSSGKESLGAWLGMLLFGMLRLAFLL